MKQVSYKNTVIITSARIYGHALHFVIGFLYTPVRKLRDAVMRHVSTKKEERRQPYACLKARQDY